MLGWIADSDNDLAGAAEHYKRALALDPRDMDVLRNSATLLASLGRLDEGAGAHGGCLAPRSSERDGAFHLGHCQRVTGGLDAAIASFRTVLSLSPSNAGAHCQLGVALLLKGDAKAALAEIEQETSEIYKMIGLRCLPRARGARPTPTPRSPP